MPKPVNIAGDIPANIMPDEQRTPARNQRVPIARLFLVGVLLLFMALLTMALRQQVISEGRTTGLAPDFEITTFDGETIRLSSLKGNGVVVNFWASWCVPCRTEAPLLEATWRRERENGIIFIGLAYLDQEPAALAFLAEFDITYPTGPDLQSAAARSYGITGVPETFFVGPDGQITSLVIGPITSASDLNHRLDAIRPQSEALR